MIIYLFMRFICLFKKHNPMIASCPFTGYTYDTCIRCGRQVIVGRTAQSANINHKPHTN